MVSKCTFVKTMMLFCSDNAVDSDRALSNLKKRLMFGNYGALTRVALMLYKRVLAVRTFLPR